MSLTIPQLSTAMENAIFRNFMDKGMRRFTPHMFIAPETGDANTVVSILFSMVRAGILDERLGLRMPGSSYALPEVYTLVTLNQAYENNPDLRRAEVLYLFEIRDDYVSQRLQFELSEQVEDYKAKNEMGS